MIDRVEGLGGIHEQNEKVFSVREEGVRNHLLLNHRIELLIEGTDVLFEEALRNEALLRRVQGGHKSGGDDADHRFRDDAVIGVGDGDGAGVFGKEGALFWNKEEDSVIIAAGGQFTRDQGDQDQVNDRRGMCVDSTPGGKANAVRTRGGVVRLEDRIFDLGEGGDQWQEGRGNSTTKFAIVILRLNVLAVPRALGPDPRPVTLRPAGHQTGVRGGRGIGVGTEGVEPLTSGRKHSLNPIEGVRSLASSGGAGLMGFRLHSRARQESVGAVSQLIKAELREGGVGTKEKKNFLLGEEE